MASSRGAKTARHALPGVVVPARLDYGLRGLLAVARGAGERVKVEQVARREGLSTKFLASTLTALRHAGIVDAQRGTDGGYRLARPASEITVVEVFEALGPDGAGRPAPSWRTIESTVREALSDLTLADVLEDGARSRVNGRRR